MSVLKSQLTKDDFRKLDRVLQQLWEDDGDNVLLLECGSELAGKQVQDHLIQVYQTEEMKAKNLFVRRHTQAAINIWGGFCPTRYRVEFYRKGNEHERV